MSDSQIELGKDDDMENVELGDDKKDKESRCREENGGLWSRALAAASPLLASRRPLPSSPSHLQMFRHALLCPPHSAVGRFITYAVAALTVWAAAYCVLGQVALPIPGSLEYLPVL